MSAASRARRLDRDLEIVAFERGAYASYAACGLPYFVADEVHSAEALIARRPEEFAKQHIDVHLRHEVLDIDPVARRVQVEDLDSGARRHEPYDELLIATGARPVVPPLPGTDLPGVHVIKRIEDAEGVVARVASGGRAVVVGGGYIGLEMVEAFVARGMHAAVIEAEERLLPFLDAPLSELVRDELENAGAEVRLETRVEGIETSRDGLRVSTSAGELPADVVIIAVGIRPNAELAAAAGLELGAGGAIVTDDRMATAQAGIWAAGDCCQCIHRVTGQPVWIPLGDTANRMGRVAGTNLGGGDDRFPGVVGTAITRAFRRGFARTGLSIREAQAAGLEVQSVHVDAADRAGYFPSRRDARVLLVWEKASGRLVGGQIAGYADAAKRIDTLAVAITAGWTVDDLRHADLAYAPPYSPTWDPVLIAANVASGKAARG